MPAAVDKHLKVNFIFKKKKKRDVATLTENIEQTAHDSTMPNLFTSPDSTWPSDDNVQTRRERMSISGRPHSQKVRTHGRRNHKSKAIE